MLSLLDSKHQRKLLKKWSPILESGSTIESDTTKTALAQVLENTYNYYASKGMIMEATTPAGARSVSKAGEMMGTFPGAGKGVFTGDWRHPYVAGDNGYGDFYLPNVVMPILRRIFPTLIANELVGVQPLNGPIGFAMAYRPTYAGNGFAGSGALSSQTSEIGYAPVDTRYTGTGYGDERLSGDISTQTDIKGPFETGKDSMWAAYAGADAGVWSGTGVDTALAEYADLNKGEYPTVTFGLVKTGVEAKTRKLGAHWSPELAEDMQAMHGIDVEKEMVNILSYEIGAEIDRQIITEMVRAAILGGSTSEWNPGSADGLDQMGRLATLLTHITIEAQQIAIRTRRGNANFVVTSPRVCALLQQMSMNKFTSFKNGANMPSVPDTGVGALTKVGLINDDQQLLVRDSYASGDYVLMGYKGSHPGDSGLIYCPYIPLQLSKVLQPGTFTPSIGARTRYGVMSNPWDARNYYCFMKISGLNAAYEWGSTRNFIATPSPLKVNGLTNNDTVFPQPTV